MLGSPAVKRAEIDLGNGRSFVVVAENQSAKNIYVSEVWLDGKRLERSFITHEEVMRGGELRFVMSGEANRGSNEWKKPYSVSR